MKNSLNTKKLYLTNWSYNSALILAELENIVKSNGGKLCATWEYGEPPAWLTKRGEPCEITNRTLSKAIHEKREHYERLKTRGRLEAQEACKKELEQLENINNGPVKSFYGEWKYINFILDDFYYSYSMDDNPFFDFHYSKRHIENKNKINRNYYCNIDDKIWWDDDFWRWNRSEAEIKKAAQIIFNMLTTAKESKTYIDKKRKLYTNIYFLED